MILEKAWASVVDWSWNQIWGWCWDEADNFEVDEDADMGDGDTGGSEDEHYKSVEQRLAAKLAARAENVFKVCLLSALLFATS